MSLIEIQATGEVPTEFDGELKQTWSNQWVNGRDRNRYYTINLYNNHDNDEFVAVVTWHTHWQGESDNTAIFECETVADFIAVLRQVDPTQHLLGYPKGVHFADKQKDLKSQISIDWQNLKAEIAKDLGIKKHLRRGKPSHPLGVCSNPGWSIPQQIIDAVSDLSIDGARPSQTVTEILAAHFNLEVGDALN
jgi:hypothetical protein